MDWTDKRQWDKESQNGKERGIVCEVSSHTCWHCFNLRAKRRPDGPHTHKHTHSYRVNMSTSRALVCVWKAAVFLIRWKIIYLCDIITYKNDGSLMWQVYDYDYILFFILAMLSMFHMFWQRLMFSSSIVVCYMLSLLLKQNSQSSQRSSRTWRFWTHLQHRLLYLCTRVDVKSLHTGESVRTERNSTKRHRTPRESAPLW